MQKNIVILLLLLTIGITGSLLFQSKQQNTLLQEQIIRLMPLDITKLGSGTVDCRTLDVEYTVSGNSMTPLIQNGQKLQVSENYYVCNPTVKRHDIITYESSTTNGSIVKQVRVLPGDGVKFSNYIMILNGETLTNSAGKSYIFSDTEIRLMSAYLQDGKLQAGSFFAFGDNLTNSIDSRKMGGLGINNFKGKVILK